MSVRREFLPGISSLACCIRQNQSIGEVMRRAAKAKRIFTARSLAEEHFASANRFGDKRQRVLVITGFTCPCSGREMSTNVALCLQMYTYVAPISVFWDAILRLTEQVLVVPEGYREDDLGSFRHVSADRFHLQVLLGREQCLFSSCASNVNSVGPLGGPTRGTYAIQAALLGIEPIRCNYPGLGRSKSTHVDLSRRKSTEFLFFWTFYLI